MFEAKSACNRGEDGKMGRKAVEALVLVALLLASAALTANVSIGKASGVAHASNSFLISYVPPPVEWNKTYGGVANDDAYSVVQTSDGGYVVAGSTDSFGAGGYDFWLVKADSDGNMLWNQTYGGAYDDYAYFVVQTSDGGYALAGYTNSSGAGGADFWLVKTNSTGGMEWNQTYGGAGTDEAFSVVQVSDGGYALAGSTDSFGAGGADSWLVKTYANGTIQWNQTYGGVGDDEAWSVARTSDEGYAMAGYTDSFGAGANDSWLVKTDSSGNMQWNQMYGGIGNEGAFSVVQTSDGGYALAGSTDFFGAGGADFWLVKTNSTGGMEWNQTYGGAGTDFAWSVVQTSDGGYALAGFTSSLGAGGLDFWLVKTNSTGGMEWNQTYGGTANDGAYSVVQTSDGGYAVAGSTDSFGAGAEDFCLVKVANASASSPTSGIDWNSVGGYMVVGIIGVFIIGVAWSILARRRKSTKNQKTQRM
jgi:predicted secreted protein